MLSVRCPVCPGCVFCLSVTLVYSGQMVGWIKMKLGIEVGLSPSHILLDGDPPPKRGTASPIFCPCLLWSNGSMHQDATWYGGRPRPRRHCVRWGLSSLPKKGAEPPPQFSVHFYCGQTARCIKMPLGMDVDLSPGDFVLDGNPVLPPQQRGRSPLPIFGPFLQRAAMY